MKALFRPRWLMIVAIATLAVAGTRLTASWLLPGAHARLVQQYRATVRALPEDQAARFLARLSQKGAEWAEVIVSAIADDRLLVAEAAERELKSLALRLKQSPPEERSLQAVRLARALAATAANLPPDRRSLVSSLAHELIAWPIDSRIVDAAQFLADCEAVALLPIAEPVEIRVAAAPPPPELPLPEFSPPEFPPQELSPMQPAPGLAPAESTPQPAPVVIAPEPPPPTAPPALSPNEPQRFVPGRSLRISDD